MSSSLLFAAGAAVGCFTLYQKIRFHQREKEKDSSSMSPQIMACSPFPHSMTYDVFPSFHGTDVRKAFLSHILKEFKSKGINSFIDNDIERSKQIGPKLIDAIRGSRIAVVLLSRNYASSSWCLNELVQIMKCRGMGQIVMTVFFEVDPTDVKKQTGDFGRAFRKTCAGKKKEEIDQWRQALSEVATIAGEHSSKCNDEATMIENITTDILNKLHYSMPSTDFDGFIGLGAHLERMKPLLRLDLEAEVRMIGIWGPPGIGKTTIARSLYHQLSSSFHHSVFVENIKLSRDTRPCSGDYSAKLHLQQQLLSQLFQKDVKIPHLGVAQERLKDKKVLVVLDDVDQLLQLEAMAKEIEWFGPGSRIIITTQDEKVLKAHGVKQIYVVDVPPPHETLQIFCMSAFGQNSPYDGFEKLAWKVTNLVGKLPLVLRVMGSYFRGMSKLEWKKALPRLTAQLDGKLTSILKLSYDALDKEEQTLFLHIACFFNYTSIKEMEDYLADKFVDLRQGLEILADKSLISMSISGFIEMHKPLEQLGREIVRHDEPGKRRFLVDARDICEVLSDHTTVSKSVIGINLNLSELSGDLTISETAFRGLPNLQLLRFHYPIGNQRNLLHLPRGLNYLPSRIRLLQWDHYPRTCLPADFNAESLVEINLRNSKLAKLWDGIKPLVNLKRMNLSYSYELKELPDLSNAINLERLELTGCTNLVNLPSSIGDAFNLTQLDLVHCSSLVRLPSSVGNITNLQNLDLGNCLNLAELPSSIGNLIKLEKMDLSHCSSLTELPYSIGKAISLRELDLSHCTSLVELPSSIGNATNLQKLDVSHCSSIVELPSSIGNATNLTELYLKGCSGLVELPSSIGNASNLHKLYLNNCSSLEKLPSSIGSACNLEKLDLSNCSSMVELPSSLGNAMNLLYLNLIGCSRLVKLPSLGNLTKLKILYLNNCSNLVELHASIGNAIALEKLDMSNCSSLVELPSSIGKATNLRKLKLANCSSLVKLPFSIGNLCKLQMLSLKGCSKLEVLLININMESLNELDLKDCPLLKSFPDNIGKATEEALLSMRQWYRLSKLKMSYCESLREFPHALNCITELHLTDIETKEVSPWVKGISRLRRFVLSGCRKLVSIPQLSDSLSSLHADNCESLERLDCSFHNPQIRLNFANCFKLNKEARALIIHTSTRRHIILPGREVPAYFTYRATGNSLIVKLNERHLPISLRFKACILPISKGDDDTVDEESLMRVYTRIVDKENGLTVPCRSRDQILPPPLTEHLYTFEVEAKVTAPEVLFEFSVHRDNWEIGECGVLELMEVPCVHEHDVSSDSDIGDKH